MWEYLKTEIKYQNKYQLDDELKKLGDDNWEIILYKEKDNKNFSPTNIVDILAKRKK